MFLQYLSAFFFFSVITKQWHLCDISVQGVCVYVCVYFKKKQQKWKILKFLKASCIYFCELIDSPYTAERNW